MHSESAEASMRWKYVRPQVSFSKCVCCTCCTTGDVLSKSHVIIQPVRCVSANSYTTNGLLQCSSNLYSICLISVLPAPHHHQLIPREECHKTERSRSGHVADDLPGVGCRVVDIDRVHVTC